MNHVTLKTTYQWMGNESCDKSLILNQNRKDQNYSDSFKDTCAVIDKLNYIITAYGDSP